MEESWQEQLKRSLRSPEEIARFFGLDIAEVRRIARHFRVQITPYFAELIKAKGAPLYRQVVPDPAELDECRPPLSRPGAFPGFPPLRLLLPVLHAQAQGR
jgi:lysine 2,3-aminomutase